MQTIDVSNQYADNSITEKVAFGDTGIPVVATALQHADMKKLSVRVAAGQGVTLTELPVTGLLVLRAQADKPALQAALKTVLNLDLPGVLSSDTDAGHCVRWIAPDEWLLSCAVQNAFDIENKIRSACGDASIAVVNVSGGFTLINVSGPHANDVLKKSTAYDVHPTNFTPGKVVNTVFAKAQVTMRCIDTEQVELIVRRSFADYVWHWIQVVSAEYGLSISVDE